MAAESERRRNRPESSASFYDYLFVFFLFFLNFPFQCGDTRKKKTAPPPCTRSSGRRLLLHLMMIKRSAPCDKTRVVKLHIFLRFLHFFFRNKLCKWGGGINSREKKILKFKFNSIRPPRTLEWIYRNLNLLKRIFLSYFCE